MAKPKIELNHKGIATLLRSPRVQADLEARAARIAAAAGPGHEVRAAPSRARARAEVVTATSAARRAEATTRSLTRAVDAGR